MAFLDWLPLIGQVFSSTTDAATNAYATQKDAEGRIRAQELANEANLKMNSDNNFANLSLARQQNEWNIAQWNRENEYNSPSAQFSRLQQAGLNPYMSLGMATNGNTSSSLTSADLANQKAGHIDPVPQLSPKALSLQAASQSASQLFNQAIERWQQYRANEADIKARETANTYAPLNYEASLNKFSSEIKLNLAKEDEQRVRNAYLHAFYDDGSVAAADKRVKELSTSQALLDLHESFERVNGLRIANQIQSYIAAEHKELSEAMPIKVYLELGMMLANIKKTYADIDIGKKNADSQARIAGAAERSAKAAEVSANAQQRQADIASFDAHTRRMLAEADIKLKDGLWQLTSTERWYMAQETVKTIVETNHMRLSNKMQGWMVDAVYANLPDYIDMVGYKINADKVRGLQGSSLTRAIISDFVDFSLKGSQSFLNVGLGVSALKSSGVIPFLPTGSNSVGTQPSQPPSFINNWNE